METKEKSVGLRLDRHVYDEAMKTKELAKGKEGAAYSTQAWFSQLVVKGLEKMYEEGLVVKNE
jgi:hypothetical protein